MWHCRYCVCFLCVYTMFCILLAAVIPWKTMHAVQISVGSFVFASHRTLYFAI